MAAACELQLDALSGSQVRSHPRRSAREIVPEGCKVCEECGFINAGELEPILNGAYRARRRVASVHDELLATPIADLAGCWVPVRCTTRCTSSCYLPLKLMAAKHPGRLDRSAALVRVRAYLRDVLMLLPNWPRSCVLELSPKLWKQTREQS